MFLGAVAKTPSWRIRSKGKGRNTGHSEGKTSFITLSRIQALESLGLNGGFEWTCNGTAKATRTRTSVVEWWMRHCRFTLESSGGGSVRSEEQQYLLGRAQDPTRTATKQSGRNWGPLANGRKSAHC
jgi:hypothetical protein